MLLSTDYMDLDISIKNYNVSVADTAFITQQRISRNKFIVPESLDSFMRILPLKAIEGNSIIKKGPYQYFQKTTRLYI